MKIRLWPFESDKAKEPERLLDEAMQDRLDILLKEARMVMDTLKQKVEEATVSPNGKSPATKRKKA